MPTVWVLPLLEEHTCTLSWPIGWTSLLSGGFPSSPDKGIPLGFLLKNLLCPALLNLPKVNLTDCLKLRISHKLPSFFIHSYLSLPEN